jgi:hypothetical protein
MEDSVAALRRVEQPDDDLAGAPYFKGSLEIGWRQPGPRAAGGWPQTIGVPCSSAACVASRSPPSRDIAYSPTGPTCGARLSLLGPFLGYPRILGCSERVLRREWE